MDLAKYAAAHLELHLAVLNRACRAAVARQQAEAALLDHPELANRCITDRQVALLLDRADRFVAEPRDVCPIRLTDRERSAEQQLRNLAGQALPLDALAARYRLDDLDRQALIALAAPELDRAYERIYAFIGDEFERRYPSVETLLDLTEGVRDRHRRRIALGPSGALRRTGLVRARGDAPTDLRQELRLAPGVLEALLGASIDIAALGLAGPIPIAAEVVCRPHSIDRLAAALRAREVDAIAIVAADRAVADAAAVQVIEQSGAAPQAADPADLRAALLTAGDAPVWLPLDDVDRPDLFRILAATTHPVVVTMVAPYRPAEVLARRRWVETEAVCAERPVIAAATTMWADTEAAMTGRAADPEKARLAVTAPGPDRLLRTVKPTRGADDLILPEALHRQVLEIATFARTLPELTERWRANRLLGGVHGVKALFTGDPGTGKTLAAEVIAHQLGVPLAKVDLSRVVSKWVGETSHHLEEVFRTVEDSSAVLFFDEADALFGKRGEVRHGTDRYANTEVSHLLQRFEAYPGLVILASNLRDNIDPAFTRRFHTVVTFPRPAPAERRRLWLAALPAGRGPDIDPDLLATLDLTGAGIVGAVRTAGLLAGAGSLRMSHLTEGLTRQFRAEGRLFSPAALSGR